MVYSAAAWALGIAIASIIALPTMVWSWWLILPIGLLLIWRRDSQIRRAHVLLLLFVLSALRYTLALPPAEWKETDLAFYNDSRAMLLIGDVITAPDARDRTTHIRLSVTRVRVENVWHDVSGLALIQAPRETDVRYGDQIQVYGEPRTPPEFDDFSYKDYLARQGIHSLVRVYGGVRVLIGEQGNPFFSAMYAFRERAHTTIQQIFPEPAASLLAGILLGIESGIPRDVREDFNATNTAHIIAISGFNIAILSGIFAALARRIVGERRGTFVVVAGLVIYTLLVGAAASVVRAAIMGSLTVIAQQIRRPNAPINALAIAAFLMLAQNPFTLFDVGFQLSFLATLGLILYVTPLTLGFENFLRRFTSSERAKQIVGIFSDSFIVTIAAQITTTPLVVFVFHRLSVIGLLANFLILPAQPAVMILGGLATLTAMLVQPVGQIIAWVAWAFPQFTIVVVQSLARFPFASIEVGRFDILILFAYYALLFGFTFFKRSTSAPVASRVTPVSGLKPAPVLAAGITLVSGIWLWNLIGVLPDGKAHIEFLDSGGAATFVRTPNGTRVLIDGGANPSATLSALGQRMPFWDRTLDLLVITDVDDRHLAGAVAVLERYAVRQIVAIDGTRKSATYAKWRELIGVSQIPILPMQAGLRLDLDRGVALEILHADADSAIVRLQTGEVVFLFAESASMDNRPNVDLASTVLIAPRKLSKEFVDAVNPQFVILFVDDGAQSKPSAELLETLAHTTLLRTDERGKIEMVVAGQALSINTAR